MKRRLTLGLLAISAAVLAIVLSGGPESVPAQPDSRKGEVPRKRHESDTSRAQGSGLQRSEETIPATDSAESLHERFGLEQVVLDAATSQFVEDNINKSMIRMINRLNNLFDKAATGELGDLLREKVGLIEAERLLAVQRHEEYLERFKRGEYLVVPQGKALEGVELSYARNVGVQFDGKPVTVVIPIGAHKQPMSDAISKVARLRRSWLKAVAYDFNSKSAAERRRLLQKRRSNPRWAREHLPTEIHIAESTLLASVPDGQ